VVLVKLLHIGAIIIVVGLTWFAIDRMVLAPNDPCRT
jgi:hypothetical protein